MTTNAEKHIENHDRMQIRQLIKQSEPVILIEEHKGLVESNNVSFYTL